MTNNSLLLTCTVILINPLLPEGDLQILLSNARRFYSSKGDPLGLKGLKQYLP